MVGWDQPSYTKTTVWILKSGQPAELVLPHGQYSLDRVTGVSRPLNAVSARMVSFGMAEKPQTLGRFISEFSTMTVTILNFPPRRFRQLYLLGG